MQAIPDTLRYTTDHEWARIEADGSVTIGITSYAVDQLGDITMVTLPNIGDSVQAGQHFGDVDSVKAVSELLAPISGEVIAVNTDLADAPERLNDDPYTAAWMIRVRPSNAAELEQLLSASQYLKHTAQHG